MRKPRPNQIFVDGQVVYERRVVMEKLLDRKLGRNEFVTNLNGDTHDNRPENLALRVVETDKDKIHHKQYRSNFLNRWRTKLAEDSGVDKCFVTNEVAVLYSLTSRVHGGPNR